MSSELSKTQFAGLAAGLAIFATAGIAGAEILNKKNNTVSDQFNLIQETIPKELPQETPVIEAYGPVDMSSTETPPPAAPIPQPFDLGCPEMKRGGGMYLGNSRLESRESFSSGGVSSHSILPQPKSGDSSYKFEYVPMEKRNTTLYRNPGMFIVSESNRNSSYDLRDNIHVPKNNNLSPWMQSTIMPDHKRKSLFG